MTKRKKRVPSWAPRPRRESKKWFADRVRDLLVKEHHAAWLTFATLAFELSRAARQRFPTGSPRSHDGSPTGSRMARRSGEADMTKAKPKYGANGVRPSGRVLIHNHVRRYDVMKPGVNGFRTWYDYLTGPYSLDLRLLGLRHSEPPPALSSACRRSSRLRKTADPRSSAAAQIVHVLREQF